nr:PREDICTED: HAUS augmin-like complex subunit 2 isoform X1 [Lepisosteus oculatus]XP_015206160.1 PREDICTED: HAUS augmin-like complex subunit 2 isoform X1 [Lepisosteus oculatus]XP_015206161.1 PREDICTED: HAUS augmin-like complex subunit 2 isoform X1 [Lepisosteus oculatus]XP_015206162.1 PREDICTED: HAUS augmin-like complex subunit 2 isoform X1 [Lepisosteus oculatus]
MMISVDEWRVPALEMNPWVPAPYAVTPAAQVLARCVASGALSEDVDGIPRDITVFSPQLLEAEQVAALRHDINEKSLEVELLQLEKEGAEVTHSFYLSKKFEALQQFTSHLQEVLHERRSLWQRLMKPHCQQNLPVEANLHRYVVQLVSMAADFIKNLESRVQTTRSIPDIGQSMASLDNALTRLLSLVSDVEELSKQILQWKDLQINAPKQSPEKH